MRAPQLMDQAKAMDKTLALARSGKATLPPLFCVPLLVKDNYDVVSALGEGDGHTSACVPCMQALRRRCVCAPLMRRCRALP